jgi:hypothetical protein
MNYTLFAIACYIVMRGMQVLFEESLKKKWFKITIKIITIVMIYAALASIIVWYQEIHLLGFSPSK